MLSRILSIRGGSQGYMLMSFMGSDVTSSMVDGSIRFLDNSIDRTLYNNLRAIADGDCVGRF